MKSIVRMGLICTLIVGSVLVYAETSPKWDWPFKRLDIQVMNTISSLQFYGPTPGFHHGVDLLAKGEEAVYAPVSGKIGTRYYYKRESRYTYEIFFELETGYRVELHHIDRDSIPKEIEALAKQGGMVSKGTYLGTIFDSSGMGIPPHLHINLIDPFGFYANALAMFPTLEDKRAPVIRGVYLAEQFEGGARQVKLPLQNPTTNSKQFILIDAFDQIHENPLHLSIHRLVVSRIMGSNRTIISDINFDKLPQQNFLNGTDIYMTDKVLLDNDEYLPGDMNDLVSRRFLYRIPLINQEKLAPDNYHFEIQVWDISGNKTSKFVHL